MVCGISRIGPGKESVNVCFHSFWEVSFMEDSCPMISLPKGMAGRRRSCLGFSSTHRSKALLMIDC